VFREGVFLDMQYIAWVVAPATGCDYEHFFQEEVYQKPGLPGYWGLIPVDQPESRVDMKE